MGRTLAALAVLFLLLRVVTVAAYRDTLYCYGLVSHQFSIAEAAYKGHGFTYDAVLTENASKEANRSGRHIPLEEWARLAGSGEYTAYPAADLPGLGYLIAATSRRFGDRLTTRYAMAIQVSVELASLLLFAGCVASVFGPRVALLAGLVYVLGYPFIWPLASKPMRDVFLVGFYACFVAAIVVFARSVGVLSYVLPGLLLATGSLLLWVRPHGYYFGVFVLPLVALLRGRSLCARSIFATMVVLTPWLVFGYPLRQFNLRHYGVADTYALGATLWEKMGIVKDNPYGFVASDEALLPWVQRHYGKHVEYLSPEMNRRLFDHATQVIRDDPGFYLKSVALTCLAMAKTPLDFVPPFPLVEYSSSGLSLRAYARAHPLSLVFKVFNRVLLASFFYGGLLLTLRLVRRRPAQVLEIGILMSPLLFTVIVQALGHFESRYMAVGAWVLVLPWACGLEECIGRCRPWSRGSRHQARAHEDRCNREAQRVPTPRSSVEVGRIGRLPTELVRHLPEPVRAMTVRYQPQ